MEKRLRGLKIVHSPFVPDPIEAWELKTLKQFCKFHESYLIGLEKYLSFRLGFDVRIFSNLQKTFLKCDGYKETGCYKINGALVCSTRIYHRLMESL